MAKDSSEKLRDVFDLCDVEGKGYISVDHFIHLAKDNFGIDKEGEKVNISLCVFYIIRVTSCLLLFL